MKEENELQGEEATPRTMAAAYADKPIDIKKVKIIYNTWWEKLLSIALILPRYRMLSLTQLCSAALYEVVAIYDELKITNDVVDDMDGILYRLVKDNMPSIIEAISIAVHNGKGNPPKWLVDALWYQFTPHELALASVQVYRGLDFESFFGILTSVRKVTMMDILGTHARGQELKTR